MASGAIGSVAREIHRLFGGGSVSGLDEGELLRRFATRRDPAALEALVTRHGPMVMGVCRRVLGNSHDAEDAFQAAFLVLARKAGAIRDPDRLGSWLHGVAHRVAVRARANAAKRRNRERPGVEDAAMATSSSEGDFDRAELRATLDEEVRRLPEKFRAPVILCYLDGLTHDEAASRLRCPVGTVRSRLATGRSRLRDRLARRGVAVPSGVFAAALASEAASAAVPAILHESTVRAAMAFAASGAGATAAGMVSAGAASLADGVTTTMFITKLKVLGGLALAGVLTLGAGGAAAQRFGVGVGGAEAARQGDDALDDLIARLRKQSRESEERTRRLEAELKETRAALEAARDRLEARGRARRDEGEDAANRPRPGEGESGPGAGTAPRGAAAGRGQGPAAGSGSGSTVSGKMQGRAGMPGMGGFMPAMGGAGGLGGGAGMEGGAGHDPFGPQAGMGGMMGGPGGGMMAGGMGMGMGGMMGAMGGGPGMGGMMGAMGGRTGMSIPATIESAEFIVHHTPKSDKVSAYSNETGEWVTYKVPEGSDVQPIVSGTIAALYATGEEIRQIATFDSKAGKWYPIDLKTPAKGHVTPVVGGDVAVYPIGRYVYAFSAPARAWDVLELEEGAEPRPNLWTNRVTVVHKDHFYIFSRKTGKWIDFDTKAGKVVGAEGK